MAVLTRRDQCSDPPISSSSSLRTSFKTGAILEVPSTGKGGGTDGGGDKEMSRESGGVMDAVAKVA